MFRKETRVPDFGNLAAVLERKPTERPVLFDFIIGRQKESMLLEGKVSYATELDAVITNIKAFDSAGFDHASIVVRGLEFARRGHYQTDAATKSLNEGTMITDRASFDRYVWPEPASCDFSIIRRAGEYMNKNVKAIPFSVDGILENTIGILGFENMCYMLYDCPDVVSDVFEEVGRRITDYFLQCLEYDEVGAVLCNDDWGFNSQTMFPPAVLRRYVFPWYREVAEAAHAKGKYAILHSCGFYGGIIDDIIDSIGFDGRHSYEDKITPVEEAYETVGSRIAVLGGIDVDFLARRSPEEIYSRCRAMLRRTRSRGGYALGSGNSVPDYIPDENYKALLRAAHEDYEE